MLLSAGVIHTSVTETKGAILMQNQLENYAKTEEAKVEELTKALADSGAKVFLSGAAVGDLALHVCKHCKNDSGKSYPHSTGTVHPVAQK
ncbi:T-complex protein 1 subunit [Musa troglodytarum]|uniref:T-complex protein 1 subunit n=1 Tax=Musa troglodytarum TaxID=320322 RepID=A0A9E7HVD0_9LILI|nr:T-complex protein 1 subunit [Musa troglodytarum]